MALVRQGWPSAFETIYGRYHRSILSFCRHVLSDPDEAEDVVQHTFLAAYNDLISSEKPIQLRPWLFTIARNRCYSVLRTRREQPQAELGEPATEGLAAQVQRRQDLRDLVGDLRGLPDDQRTALVLAELDALSHDEIGEVLGVPSKKVKALVFQARESLVASRTARETACSDIREELANNRGAALRRANLRRHLRDCQGCRDFRRQVERQRSRFALLLPVAPTLALKDGVLGAGFGAGAATGIATGGLAASSIFKSSLLKGAIGIILAGAGAGTYVAAHNVASSSPPTPLSKNPPGHLRASARAAGAGTISPAGAAATGSLSGQSGGAVSTALLGTGVAGRGLVHDHVGSVLGAGTVAATHGRHAPASSHHRSQGAPAGATHHSHAGGQVSHHAASGGATSGHHAGTASPSSSNAPYLGNSAYGSGAQTSAGSSRGTTSSGGSGGGGSSSAGSGSGISSHVLGGGGSSAGGATRGASPGAPSGSGSSSPSGIRGSSGNATSSGGPSSGGSPSNSSSSPSASPTPSTPVASTPAPTSSTSTGGGTRGSSSGSAGSTGSSAGGSSAGGSSAGGSGSAGSSSGGSGGGSGTR